MFEVKRTRKGEGTAFDLCVVGNASVENNQLASLGRNLGLAVDEGGIWVGLEKDERDLVFGLFAREIMVVDVRFRCTGEFGDSDGTAIFVLLLGSDLGAGNLVKALGNGCVEDSGAPGSCLAVSLLLFIDVDGLCRYRRC